MTCQISGQLEEQLKLRAAACQTTVEQLVEQALEAYLATPEQAHSRSDTEEWLDQFRKLQRSLSLTEEKAEEWKRTIVEGRR